MLNDILFISLAVAGFVFLIRYTDGPGDMFLDFRIWLGIYNLQDQDGSFYEKVEDNFFAKLFACHWCLSTWLVFIVMLLSRLQFDSILSWFASVFITGLLMEIVLMIRRING